MNGGTQEQQAEQREGRSARPRQQLEPVRIREDAVRPPARHESFRFGSDSSWSDFDLNGLLEDLNGTQELDGTGLSTFMLLRGAAEAYLRDVNRRRKALSLPKQEWDERKQDEK